MVYGPVGFESRPKYGLVTVQRGLFQNELEVIWVTMRDENINAYQTVTSYLSK